MPYVASRDDHARDWVSFARIRGNPKIASAEETIAEALTPGEAERFMEHLRPLVEEGRGTERVAVARLWAVKRQVAATATVPVSAVLSVDLVPAMRRAFSDEVCSLFGKSPSVVDAGHLSRLRRG